MKADHYTATRRPKSDSVGAPVDRGLQQRRRNNDANPSLLVNGHADGPSNSEPRPRAVIGFGPFSQNDCDVEFRRRNSLGDMEHQANLSNLPAFDRAETEIEQRNAGAIKLENLSAPCSGCNSVGDAFEHRCLRSGYPSRQNRNRKEADASHVCWSQTKIILAVGVIS